MNRTLLSLSLALFAIGIFSIDAGAASSGRRAATTTQEVSAYRIGRVGATTPPPPNDNFSNATPLSGTSGHIDGNNFYATAEPNEPPSVYGGGPTHSVWFAWTAPQSAAYSFEPSNFSFEMMMVAYTGNTLSTLTSVATAPFGGILTFRAQQGVTY